MKEIIINETTYEMVSIIDVNEIVTQEVSKLRKEYQQLLLLTLSHESITPIQNLVR